jgi:hypothetical protein
MKLKDLKPVLYSSRGAVQFAIVYDQEKNTDLENGCAIDYAVEKYGDRTVRHIEALENQLLVTV